MESLRAEMARSRRQRRMKTSALALLLAALLGFSLWVGDDGVRGPTLVAAVIPSTTSPVFVSASGLAEPLPSGQWVIRGGGAP